MDHLFSKEIEKEITMLFEEVAKNIGNQVGEKCLSSLKAQYSEIWKPFEDRVKKLIENLDQEIQSEKNISQSIIQQKDLLLKQLESFKSQASNAIQLSLETFEKNLLQNFQKTVYDRMHDCIQKNIETIAKNLSAVLDSLRLKADSFSHETKDILNSFVQDTKNTLDGIKKSTKASLEQTSKDSKDTLEEIEKNAKTSLDKMVRDGKSSFENISKVIQQIRENHENKVAETLQQNQMHWVDTTNKMKQDIHEFRQEGNKTLQSLQKYQSDVHENLQRYQIFFEQKDTEIKSMIQMKWLDIESHLLKTDNKIRLLSYGNIANLFLLFTLLTLFLLKHFSLI